MPPNLRDFAAARTLSRAERSRLEGLLEPASFEPGSTLFRRGDPPDALFFLLAGSVRVWVPLGDERVLLGRPGPGEFLGEMGVLDGSERSATAEAETRVEALLLPRQRYLDLLESADPLARWLLDAIAADLTRRIRVTLDRVVSVREDPRLLTELPSEPAERVRHWWAFLWAWRKP